MRNKSLEHKNYKPNWETPLDEFNYINTAFCNHLVIDVAASEKNTKCFDFISEDMDALRSTWRREKSLPDDLWWCNPPFPLVAKFLMKAFLEMEKGNEGIMLVPAAMETEWFRQFITWRNLRRLAYPRRIAFLDPDTGRPGKGNTTPSILVAFISSRIRLPEVCMEPWFNNVR